MRVVPTKLPDVFIIEPQVIDDERGFFVESFNRQRFESATGLTREWVQDNHSQSARSVLRGLHYQWPHPQGKLVRCSRGVIYDVAVDIRRSSPGFLNWVGVELSSSNHRQLWVPEGFAHGFLVLSSRADLQYKVTNYYVHENAHAIRWDDPSIDVDWPLVGQPILSATDRSAPAASQLELFE